MFEEEPYMQEERNQLRWTARMARMPRCCHCGRRIWTVTYTELDGKKYCEDCIRRNTRMSDDLMEDD